MHAEIIRHAPRTPSKPNRTGHESPADRIATLFNPRDAVRSVCPGSTVFLHGDRVESLYQIVSGTVACCSISPDGRRQIFCFARAGDVLGLTELDHWHFTATAVDHVILRPAPRERAWAQIHADSALQNAVQITAARDIAAREQHMFTLAYLPAEERLRLFLEDFASTRKSRGFVVLPMTRQDIGDHLGLTLETVSRAFSSLRRKGLIEMHGCDRFRVLADPIAQAA